LSENDASQELSKPVNALARGIAILRYLEAREEPVGVVHIARDLGINASTCFNLLRTLAHERLVVFDSATKKYAPGLGLLELARGVLKQGGHVRLVHPRLEHIADQYSVTVMLWQLASPSRALLVDLAESPTPIRVHMNVGQRLPSLIGALGRCFAAHLGLPKQRVREMFKELRWQNPPTFKQYWSEVEQARRDGFAVDIGHYNKNFTTVGAAILGPDGVATMAISAIAFSNDLDQARMLRLASDLRGAADDVSRALGSRTSGGVACGPATKRLAAPVPKKPRLASR
jgi:DNA-binding IclR family transcriptional regulator